jgi:superfamily II DNA or RNA helicase
MSQCLSSSNVEFKPHMKRVVQYLSTNRGLIVVHGTGSGKTLTAIGTSQCLLKNFPDKKVLVITPTSLVKNFKKEMVKYGLSEDDERYEFKTYGKMMRGKISSDCKNKILICDEAHNLKTKIVADKKGKLAKIMVDCAKHAFRVILLTATPIVNSKMDIANLIAMVDGNDPIKRKKFDDMISNRNSNELKNYLNNKTSFFNRSNDDPNYPRTHEKSTFLVMNDDFYKAYHKIEIGEFKEMAASEFIKTKDVFAFLSGVRRAMNVAIIEESPKIDWVVDLVKNGKDGQDPGKTLIYSTWKKAGKDLIIQKFRQYDIKFSEVHGSMSKKKRDEAVYAFNNDNSTKVLLITKAGGEGLDLKNTKFVVVIDPFWNDANLRQVLGRAARYKSHMSLPYNQRDVYIYKLHLKKPPIQWFGGIRKWKDKIQSADMLMYDFVNKKTKDLNKFLEVLKSSSIEK